MIAFVTPGLPGAVIATTNVLVATPPGPVASWVVKYTVGVKLSVVEVAAMVGGEEGVVEVMVILL